MSGFSSKNKTSADLIGFFLQKKIAFRQIIHSIPHIYIQSYKTNTPQLTRQHATIGHDDIDASTDLNHYVLSIGTLNYFEDDDETMYICSNGPCICGDCNEEDEQFSFSIAEDRDLSSQSTSVVSEDTDHYGDMDHEIVECKQDNTAESLHPEFLFSFSTINCSLEKAVQQDGGADLFDECLNKKN